MSKSEVYCGERASNVREDGGALHRGAVELHLNYTSY